MFNLTGHAISGMHVSEAPIHVRNEIEELLTFKDYGPALFLDRAFKLVQITGKYFGVLEGHVLVDPPAYFAPYLTDALTASGYEVFFVIPGGGEELGVGVNGVVPAPVMSGKMLFRRMEERIRNLEGCIASLHTYMPPPPIKTEKGTYVFNDPRPVEKRLEGLTQAIGRGFEALREGLDPLSRLRDEVNMLRERLREYEGPWPNRS